MRSWAAGLSCLFAGIGVDLDHFIDFWLNRGFSLDPRKLMDFCYHGSSARFLALFHGYEFIPVLWGIPAVLGRLDIAWGLAAGYTLHLIGDQLFNTHLCAWTYFFSFRWYHGFDSTRIVLRICDERISKA